MADETDLPEDVALLWGLREVPRRGRRPALTVEDITRAAVEVADTEGLSAVSMARVASQLGNSTMALYRHVRSKDELLALMLDAALEDPPEKVDGVGWRTGLTLWTRSLLAAVGQHPWYARLPISGPPSGPHNLAWFDRALGVLADTDLDEGEKVGVVMGLLTYTQGHIRLGLDLAASFERNPEAFGRQYGATLRRVVDPRRFPALSKVIDAGTFDADSLLADEDVQADFEFGLSLYLDGVAGHIARRTAPAVSPPTP